MNRQSILRRTLPQTGSQWKEFFDEAAIRSVLFGTEDPGEVRRFIEKNHPDGKTACSLFDWRLRHYRDVCRSDYKRKRQLMRLYAVS